MDLKVEAQCSSCAAFIFRRSELRWLQRTRKNQRKNARICRNEAVPPDPGLSARLASNERNTRACQGHLAAPGEDFSAECVNEESYVEAVTSRGWSSRRQERRRRRRRHRVRCCCCEATVDVRQFALKVIVDSGPRRRLRHSPGRRRRDSGCRHCDRLEIGAAGCGRSRRIGRRGRVSPGSLRGLSPRGACSLLRPAARLGRRRVAGRRGHPAESCLALLFRSHRRRNSKLLRQPVLGCLPGLLSNLLVYSGEDSLDLIHSRATHRAPNRSKTNQEMRQPRSAHGSIATSPTGWQMLCECCLTSEAGVSSQGSPRTNPDT